MALIIDKFKKSCVRSLIRGKRDNLNERKKRRPYNIKSVTSMIEVTRKINSIYEDSDNRLLWLTLTTVQHKTNASDKDLMYCLRKFMQHQNVGYLAVVERQRETGDLHFHLVLQGLSSINIHEWLLRWSLALSVDPNPALLDVEYIRDIKHLKSYIVKYVWKRSYDMTIVEKRYSQYGSKFKPPYSSMFWCRTTSSARLKKPLTVLRFPDEYMYLIDIGKMQYGRMVDKFKFDESTWSKALFLLKMLNRAGLLDYKDYIT